MLGVSKSPSKSAFFETWKCFFEGVGWDGVSKVSFNFRYTSWVYRSCIFLPISIIEFCHQHSYGFQNSRYDFLNSYRKICFYKIMLKVRCFKNTNDSGPFLNFFSNIFCQVGAATGLFEPARWLQASLVRTVPKPFRLNPYISLRGPAQHLNDEREARLRVGWGWWVGRNIKSVLQFSLYFVGI